MFKSKSDQQKISALISIFLILILVSIVGFGTVIVSKMTRLEMNFEHIYLHAADISKAGLEGQSTLSKMHNRMIGIILLDDKISPEQQDGEMHALDSMLRNNFSIVSTGLQVESRKVSELTGLLDDWQAIRMQMISLVRQGQREKAMHLASSNGVKIYRQLALGLDEIVTSAQHRIDTLAKEAKSKSTEMIYFVRWYLGGLILSSLLFVVIVIVKVGNILELGKQSAKKLYENEERMKLALSGADEGTWDLDITTGELNFDSQWGRILGYITDADRPHNFSDWSALIHAEDKDRVLKAMADHVSGAKPEYKAEYRMRSRSGAIKWIAGHGKAVSRDAAGKALRIVGVTRDITKKKQAEDTIWLMAHTDYLTGLPNRAMFYDRLKQSLAQAKRHDKKLAVLFMDMDNFKKVNDKYGHDIGDELLIEVAKRLSQIIRVEDTVARTGGDEFIFILNEIADSASVAIVANKIVQLMGEPFQIQGNQCRIGSSVGIAIFPDDTDKMETLITLADNAMYKAKDQGKNNFQFSTVILP